MHLPGKVTFGSDGTSLSDVGRNVSISMAVDGSLVIPGRNVAGGIRHCLDAVFRMMPEYAPTEVIFVNDGSTDETAR
jgi:hypothetical protein